MNNVHEYKLDAHRLNKRTVQHLLQNLTTTEGHAGKLLAKTGDKDGYTEGMKFTQELREAIEDVYEYYYGVKSND